MSSSGTAGAVVVVGWGGGCVEGWGWGYAWWGSGVEEVCCC